MIDLLMPKLNKLWVFSFKFIEGFTKEGKPTVELSLSHGEFLMNANKVKGGFFFRDFDSEKL